MDPPPPHTSTTSSASTTPASTPAPAQIRVIWNGKIGLLGTDNGGMVFTPHEDITTTMRSSSSRIRRTSSSIRRIPWRWIHTCYPPQQDAVIAAATDGNTTSSGVVDDHVDLRIGLVNGQTIELHFPPSSTQVPTKPRNLAVQIQQEIIQRIQQSQQQQQQQHTTQPEATTATTTGRQAIIAKRSSARKDLGSRVPPLIAPETAAAAAPSPTTISNSTTPTHDSTNSTSTNTSSTASAPHDLDFVMIKAKDLEAKDDYLEAKSNDLEMKSSHLEAENHTLRQSVNSLMDKVGQLEGQLTQQQQDHQTTITHLIHQLEDLQKDYYHNKQQQQQEEEEPLLQQTTIPATPTPSTPSWQLAEEEEEMGLELIDRPPAPPITVSTAEQEEIIFDQQQQQQQQQQQPSLVGDLTMRNLMEGLGDDDADSQQKHAKDEEAGGGQPTTIASNNSNNSKRNRIVAHNRNSSNLKKTLSGLGKKVLPKHIRQLPSQVPAVPVKPPTLFTVQESVATEDGMNLIRRKLSFRGNRISTVTGQGAYAKTLPSDTYGFLMVTPYCSAPYILGVLVCCIQITTFLLMSISIIEEKAYDNYFGIPPNVDANVKVLQFIAIIIAVVTQDDLMKGIDQLRIKESHSFWDAYPHANIYKVYLTIIGRCTEGMLGLLASFLLIITSDTIYYLLLNFTALEFVTQLDEGFFTLSSYGFAGKTCEVAAKAIDTTTYYVHTRTFRVRKILLFVTIGASMIAGWSVVVNKQRKGFFLCDTIQVQFSDDMRPELGTFSGLYDQVTGEILGLGSPVKSRHVAYIERVPDPENHTSTGIFSYCDKDEFWTFQYRKEGFLKDSAPFDPCTNWVVRAPTSDVYDITLLTSKQWIVRNDLRREIFLDPFVLACHDCGKYNDCTGGRGVCSKGVCGCQDGFYGLQCQFEEPCGKVQMDSRFQGFQGTRSWSQEYILFKQNGTIVNSYDRPVYMHDLKDNTYDLLFFTGRRWAIAHSTELSEHFDVTSDGQAEAKSYLADAFALFNAHWANLTLGFLTEPMDLLTPVDSQSPIGLQWYSATDKQEDQVVIQTPDLNSPVEARLLCAVCSDTNPCLYSGVCVSGFCDCQPGSSGVLCEQPPLGNGRCDPFLNTPQFDWDGGDCCGTGCSSGKTYHCGRDDSNFGYTGYPICKNTPQEWNRIGNKPIAGEDKALVGYSLALSRAGNFLVAGMPGIDSVLVYDRDGGNWNPRGSRLTGPEDSFFGEDVKLASSRYSLWNTPEFTAPYTMAVRAPFEGNSTVHVFLCEATCQRQQRFNGYFAFDISDNGETLALGESTNENLHSNYLVQPKIHVYSLSEAPALQQATHADQVIEPIYKEFMPDIATRNNGNNSTHSITHLSLGRDGKTMAIQTLVKTECSQEEFQDDDDACSETAHVTNSIFGSGNKTAVLFQQRVFASYEGSRPIVLSANSKVVAYASFTCKEPMARVLKWDNSRKSWMPRPPLPTFEEDLCQDEKSVSLALSGDGSTIAVGYRGYVYMYDFIGKNNTWQSLGNANNAKAASDAFWLGQKDKSSVDLAADLSDVLAVGLPGTDVVSGGVIDVLERVLPNLNCDEKNKVALHLSLTTDDSPKDLSYAVYDNSTKKTINSVKTGFYKYSRATHVKDLCIADPSLPDGSACTIVTILDLGKATWSNSPGLQSPGLINLLVGGKVVAEGGFEGAAKRIYIGEGCLKCAGSTGLFQMYLESCEIVGYELVDNRGTRIFRGSSLPDNEVPTTVDDLWEISNSNATLPPKKSCEYESYWEDVCIDYDDNCYVFYVYLVKHPDAAGYQAETQYFLFFNGEEIKRKEVTDNGQTVYFVGNCKQPKTRQLVGWNGEYELDDT